MATVLKTPPPISAVAAAELKGIDGAVTTGASLWRDRPCVVYVLRRPGCILCRATAKRIGELAPALDALGVGMACVANQWLDAEVQAFVDGYWPPSVGPVYLDAGQAFFTAVGGGDKPRRLSLLGLLNPRAWANAQKAKQVVGNDHNLLGDGQTAGGLMVVSADKGVVYAAYETTFGDAPDDDAIMAAAREAVGK